MARRNNLKSEVWAWVDGEYIKIMEIDCDGNVKKYINDEQRKSIAQAVVNQAANTLSV